MVYQEWRRNLVRAPGHRPVLRHYLTAGPRVPRLHPDLRSRMSVPLTTHTGARRRSMPMGLRLAASVRHCHSPHPRAHPTATGHAGTSVLHRNYLHWLHLHALGGLPRLLTTLLAQFLTLPTVTTIGRGFRQQLLWHESRRMMTDLIDPSSAGAPLPLQMVS